MQVYVALQMNRPGQENAILHNNSPAPGLIAGCNGAFKCATTIRLTVAFGAKVSDEKILLRKSRWDNPA